jgi:16S rRNA (guanine527-N7)-methyltransferase
MGPEALGVSRETEARLAAHLALLGEWNPRVNLVARSTLADAWRRHVLDAAQLLPLLPEGTRSVVDLGSGAGFPGLVLAILGVPEIHLVEADARKCAFLREAARVTRCEVTIHNSRIEALPGFAADAVTARALAPLDELLGLAARFVGPRTVCLFPKGKSAREELSRAGARWRFDAETVPSRSDPEGSVLVLAGVARA